MGMDTLKAVSNFAQSIPASVAGALKSNLSEFVPADQQSRLRTSKQLLSSLLVLLLGLFLLLLAGSHLSWLRAPQALLDALLPAALLCAAGSLLLGRSIKDSRSEIPLWLAYLLPLIGLLAIYNYGYVGLSVAPLLTLIMTIALRREWIIGIILLFVLLTSTIELLSKIQGAEPYVLRLLVTAAALIWPIRTLLTFQSWDYRVRFEALTHLLWSGFVALTIIAALAATPQQVAHISVALVVLMFFGWLFKTRPHLINVWIARAFAGCISLIYWSTLGSSGFQAAIVLPLMSLLFYLVLHRGEAALLSSITLVLGIDGYLNTSNPGFDLTPLFFGWLTTNLVFVGALHSAGILFETKLSSDEQAISSTGGILIVILSALISGATFWIGHFGIRTPVSLANLLLESRELLLINAILWLLSTWVISSFAVNFLNLKRGESALKRALESEQLAVKKLEEVNDELNKRRVKQEQLFAIIGHELRTPLTSIKMLQDDMELAKRDKRGDELCKTTDTVLSILDDLRIVIRPEEAGKANLTTECPFTLIERSVNSLHSLAVENNLTIHLSSNTKGSQPVKFNAQALRQITTNLLKNAALHAKAVNAWVELRCHSSGNEQLAFTLTIEDDGTGIHGAKRDSLYEAFSRGNTDADGTGLGLYISQQLASKLGGSLSYFDSKHGGAGFALEFFLNSEKAEECESKQTLPEASLKGLHVLFAEDQATIRMLTSKQLEKQGATVVAAEDGVQALECYKSDTFDLVITDINMPNMNGYGLTQALRERGYTGCIAGLTAAVIGDETDRLIAAGANCVLAKPLDLTKLRQSLWIARKDQLQL